VDWKCCMRGIHYVDMACCCMRRTRGPVVYFAWEVQEGMLSTLYGKVQMLHICLLCTLHTESILSVMLIGLDMCVGGCGTGAAQFKEPLYVSVRIEVREVRIR